MLVYFFKFFCNVLVNIWWVAHYNKRIEQEQSKELINRETQEINGDQTEFFVVVEQMPVLIGGMGNLQKQVKYPAAARQAGIEGTELYNL